MPIVQYMEVNANGKNGNLSPNNNLCNITS